MKARPWLCAWSRPLARVRTGVGCGQERKADGHSIYLNVCSLDWMSVHTHMSPSQNRLRHPRVLSGFLGFPDTTRRDPRFLDLFPVSSGGAVVSTVENPNDQDSSGFFRAPMTAIS
jgi:hypothetical protein